MTDHGSSLGRFHRLRVTCTATKNLYLNRLHMDFSLHICAAISYSWVCARDNLYADFATHNICVNITVHINYCNYVDGHANPQAAIMAPRKKLKIYF